MLAVVLAAGRGKRLRPLTDGRSKPMLPVAGKPMVVRVMERLAAEEAAKFIVVTHPDDEPLLNLLRRSPWQKRVRLAFQETRRGMADAVARAGPLVEEEGVSEFLLSSCDNLFPEGYISELMAHRRARGLDAALTLLRVPREQVATLAVVQTEGERVTSIVEKPPPEEAPSDLGSVALYALTPRVLNYVRRVPVSHRGERELQDALQLLIDEGGAVGGLVAKGRMTLTSPADLLALNQHFLRTEPACAVVEAELPESATLVPPVRIEEGAQLGAECSVGPLVYLEAGCRVGAGARLLEAVVLRGASVPSGDHIQGSVVHQ
jgi:NDP-sugar pyrophosphorylase family protein